MNKKLTRKLTLSAVTLGVAALSLTSTTYAWFTTNGEAKAEGITGSVAASDANMLIKTPTGYSGSNGTAAWDTTFTKSVTEIKKAQNYDQSTAKAVSMQPVTWDSTVTGATHNFTKAGTNEDAAAIGSFSKTATMNEDILHYEVIFAITDLQQGATKNVSVSFANLADNKGTQYLLVDALNGNVTETSKTKATAGKTIDVSILDVLSLRVESTVIKSSSTSGELKIGDYNITDTGSTLIDSITSTDANYRYKEDVDTLRSSGSNFDDLTGNAIDYYKNVYGSTATQNMQKPEIATQGYADSKYFGADDITLFTVEGTATAHTVYVKTDFYFYIDGWDNQCFNCVGGLSLGNTGSMTFTCANKEGN